MAPGASVTVPFPDCATSISSEKDVYITVFFHLRNSYPWALAGHKVAWFQHQLSAAESKLILSLNGSSDLQVQRKRINMRIQGQNFTITYDNARGYLTGWTVKGETVLLPDPATGAAVNLSFWRPPTDNDNPLSLPYWKRFGVDSLTSQLRSSSVESTSESVTITAVTFISPPVLAWGFEATTKYVISSNGTLSVSVSLKPTGFKPEHVPRIGLDLRLPRQFDGVKWHGLGPGESYPDKKSAQRIGVWEVNSVSELQTPYEVPQENANRMETRWVTLSEPKGRTFRAIAGDASEWSSNAQRSFSWVATRHSTDVVQKAKHPCDLVEEDATLVRLDAKVAGVGTAACGPGVRDDLLAKVEDIKFSFVLEVLGG